MKHHLLGVALLLAAVSATAQPPRASNPVLRGWYADPEAHVFNGQYWIYPTYSAPYNQQVFMDAFSSRDLVTWTKHSHIIDTSSVKWATRAMWAPSVIEKDGWYYLFFGANDIQNDQQTGGIGVARSRSPAGPFVDYLGKPLIDAFHNGAQPIDQMVFRDANGSYYIVYGGWRHCNIARLNDDFTGFVPFPDGTTFKEITPKGYVEGAFMLVKDNRYYFMWSEGGWTGPDYAVAYAVGTSPFGPFERVGKILQQDPAVATGAGHHSILHAPGSSRWYIVYHRRPLGETDRNHRVVSIDELRFDANGLIEPVAITHEGVARDPLPIPALTHGHAHNDYEHERPLLGALELGYASIEVDVYLKDGVLLVAHDSDKTSPSRTLQSLYLDPLSVWIRANGGRVFSDNTTLTLLVDVKSDATATYRAIERALDGYGSTFAQSGIGGFRAVSVIISGNRDIERMKRAHDYAAIDGRIGDLAAPPLANGIMPLISIPFSSVTKWNGVEPPPSSLRADLLRITKAAHARGQRVRFWGTPDLPAVWNLLSDAAVDVIGADDLEALRAFLLTRYPPRTAVGHDSTPPSTHPTWTEMKAAFEASPPPRRADLTGNWVNTTLVFTDHYAYAGSGPDHIFSDSTGYRRGSGQLDWTLSMQKRGGRSVFISGSDSPYKQTAAVTFASNGEALFEKDEGGDTALDFRCRMPTSTRMICILGPGHEGYAVEFRRVKGSR